jgi:predicted peroxiredoxin
VNALSGCGWKNDDVKGIFVVVTSPEPQTQLMAMVLSIQTLKKGKNVRILLCGPGGDLALKEHKPMKLKPNDMSPRMLLDQLLQKRVKVEVCALYLPNKGAMPSDLIEGVTQADPSYVADALLEPEIKLFTF